MPDIGSGTNESVGGWVGQWCWVASSAGASYNFGIWLGRSLLCLQQMRDRWAFFRSNPAVVQFLPEVRSLSTG